MDSKFTSMLYNEFESSENTTSTITLAVATVPTAFGALSTSSTTITSTFEATTRSPDATDSPSVQSIIICIVLLAVIVGTIVGNVLVCVAVCLVRKLRRPCNYLLVSLAVSDLCVAVLVMPTALIYEVLGEWRFGRVFCDVWVSFDVLSCTASILNLCAISVDRYWAITKPLEYGVKRTPRRMMLCVALVWLCAACISLPPLLILGNEHVSEEGPICTVCPNLGYQIYATLGSFYIPLTVMLFVYYQIFRAARRIVMDEKRAQTRLEGALNGGDRTIITAGSSVVVAGSPHQKKLRFQLATERKASTTLGIIMSAFTVCWLPFFILALVRPLLADNHQTLSSIFLWLGYANSLLNPIIYATLNRDFRKPFQEILYFRCSSLNIMMREDFYHSQYGEPPSQRVVLGNEGGARESFL
jgi:5-hydroxytryptamine receptor 7